MDAGSRVRRIGRTKLFAALLVTALLPLLALVWVRGQGRGVSHATEPAVPPATEKRELSAEPAVELTRTLKFVVPDGASTKNIVSAKLEVPAG